MSVRFDVGGTWLLRDGSRCTSPVTATLQGRGTTRRQRLCLICRGTGRDLRFGSGSCTGCSGSKFVTEEIEVYSPGMLEVLEQEQRQKLLAKFNSQAAVFTETPEPEKDEHRQRVDAWIRGREPWLHQALRSMPHSAVLAWQILGGCYVRGTITEDELRQLVAIVEALIVGHQRIGSGRFVGGVGRRYRWPEVECFMSWSNAERNWFAMRLWDPRTRAVLFWTGPFETGSQGDVLVNFRSRIIEHRTFRGSEKQNVVDEPRWDSIIKAGMARGSRLRPTAYATA